MNQCKVLIADDEVDVTDLMAKKVMSEGYNVVKAYDGRQAWDQIITEDPDIVLLDINMPEADGFEVLKYLRTTPPSKKWQPVVIISARQELDDIKQGYDLEADHYLTKPCDMKDILKSIKLMEQLIPLRQNQGMSY